MNTNLKQVQPWYVVHTHSRCEKTVAKQMLHLNVLCWLPLIERRRKWSDRYVTIDEPLFRGYLFVKINLEDRLPILKIPGVVGFVSNNGRPCPVPEEEISNVQRALESNLKCDPYPHLTVGKKVEITRGPLRGIQGILDHKSGRHRVVLSVTLISQSVALEISSMDLKPA